MQCALPVAVVPVVTGRYYLNENLDILCDTLVRGFAAHGMPTALYVDNAKVYHSQSLKKACYRLGINLLHRKGLPNSGRLSLGNSGLLGNYPVGTS